MFAAYKTGCHCPNKDDVLVSPFAGPHVKIRKEILFILSLGCLIVSISVLALENSAFTGRWSFVEHHAGSEVPYSTLQIQLLEDKDGSIRGSYCFILQSGNRIDCDDRGKELNIAGRAGATGRKAVVHFYSFFGAKDGIAELTLINDRLLWDVKKEPQGDFFYGPFKAELKAEQKDLHTGERVIVLDKTHLYRMPKRSVELKDTIVKGQYVKPVAISDDLKFWKVQYVRDDGQPFEGWVACKAIDFCP
ncbi:hypothetical protein [Dyella japonica]|uniref:hypothetical protein n=1 Tax=Dyella japonica TaxID=231455 RepID=UPI0011851508|nr:hypothetical protein [Dyella japonica]